MGNYNIFLMFENPRRGRQARNLTTNVPKILDLKSSSEEILFRKLTLGAPDIAATIADADLKSNTWPKRACLSSPKVNLN